MSNTTVGPRDARRARVTRRQRYHLVTVIEQLLDAPATFLAIVFAALTTADIVVLTQGGQPPAVIGWLLTAIWIFFIVQFVLGLTIAPNRLAYVRTNWLTALSLLVPFLRVFRVLRVAVALRATNSIRVLAGFNRATRSLHATLAWSRAGYAAGLSITAMLLGSAALFMFEANATGSEIRTYGDALWWAAATLTTIGAEHEPVTAGGRTVGLLLMIGGLVILGYIAGVLGSLLFDRRRSLGSTARDRTRPPEQPAVGS